MTDLERSIELYKSFGIELAPVDVRSTKGTDWITCVEFTAHGGSDKLKFHGNSYSEVLFTLEGDFLLQEFWE